MMMTVSTLRCRSPSHSQSQISLGSQLALASTRSRFRVHPQSRLTLALEKKPWFQLRAMTLRRAAALTKAASIQKSRTAAAPRMMRITRTRFQLAPPHPNLKVDQTLHGMPLSRSMVALAQAHKMMTAVVI